MDFKVIKGNILIFLSAPHAKPHLRPGFNLQNPKPGEVNTDLVVKELCSRTKCWGIYTTKLNIIDPNWYKNSPYKEKIKEIIIQNKIRLVLDIHGAKAQRLFMIEYDDFRTNRSLKQIETILKNCLKRHGFAQKEIAHGLLKENTQETITEYCLLKLKTPALQLEINQKLRHKDNPRFYSLFSALSCLVHKVQKLDNKFINNLIY